MMRITGTACLAYCLTRHDRISPLRPTATCSGRRRRVPWRWGTRYGWTVLLGVVLLVAPGAAGAQPVAIPSTWGGDFWSRPRLTGDWGGLRDELGKKDVVFDVDLLLTPQWVMTGGRDTDAVFWGNADYTLDVDTGKLGLWPGGFFKVFADTGFGQSVFESPRNFHSLNLSEFVDGCSESISRSLRLYAAPLFA